MRLAYATFCAQMSREPMMLQRCVRVLVVGFLCLAVWTPRTVCGGGVAYGQTNLITSATDPDLINPWGISSSSTSPFWVSDNGTGKSTLYNGAGMKQGLIVSMPSADPITGQVFNGTSNFNGSTFIFASENGTIDYWKGALGTTAAQLFSVTDAVYKGLAISTGHDLLFAANFHSGAIDVFDSTHLTGSFTDPNAPTGYAPFNIQNIGGKFYVTFALQDAAKHDDVAGAGNGFVDVFDPVSHTFTRLITGTSISGGMAALNSPWGLALALGHSARSAAHFSWGTSVMEPSTALIPRPGRCSARSRMIRGTRSSTPGSGDCNSATVTRRSIQTRSTSPLAGRTRAVACSRESAQSPSRVRSSWACLLWAVFSSRGGASNAKARRLFDEIKETSPVGY